MRRSLAAAGIDAQVFDLVPGPDSGIYAYTTYLDAAASRAEG